MMPRLFRRLLPLLTLVAPCAGVGAPDAPAPLTLEQAVQRALAKNYTIQVKAIGQPIARAALTEAYGKFDLRIEGSYQDARNEQPALASPLTGLRPLADITKETTASLGVVGLMPWGTSYRLGADTTNDQIGRAHV